jgi:predicted nucleic acid-binding protein
VRSLIVHEATLFDDPPAQPGLTPDPKDDYIVALARAAGVDFIVSGDRHLPDMAAPQPPVVGQRVFLALLDATERR